jgi:microcystin-dependent protein
MDAYIGDIRLFAGSYAPRGWMLCAGQLLSISDQSTLFALIGTTYGGDGVSTFQLPDLRGRLPVGQGNGSGLTPRVLGQQFGSESVTVLSTQMPSHNHTFSASTTNPSTSASPTGNVFAHSNTDNIYTPLPTTGADPQVMNLASVQSAGGTQPHNNIMPTTAINYIMCVEGIFPSRN